MKTRSNLRLSILWLGFGLGLTLLILGMVTGGVLLTLSRAAASFAIHSDPPLVTPSLASATSTNIPTTPPENSPAAPTSAPAPTSEVTTYTVEEGDTLYDIAFRHNTTAKAIMEANPTLTSPDNIRPGQVFIIPDSIPVTPVTSTTSSRDESVISHTVTSGETLADISLHYGVSIEVLQTANGLSSDFIEAGSELLIPLTETAISQTTTGTVVGPGWQPSIIEGDLNAFYTQAEDTERFTLHYQPDSLAAQDLGTLLEMIRTALTHIENILDVHLDGEFDTYAAGSLFRAPNLALRGRSFSSERRFLFLYDGTGSYADQQYIVTHELTHVTTWNTMGNPSSVMLHEGVAVYTGMELVEDNGYIPLELFCAAYDRVGQLPNISASPSFNGHIRDLVNYYSAGCFVQFLIEEYGTGKFATVYHTGDYYSVYGKDIVALETQWIASIQASEHSFPFDPDELVHYVNKVAVAYDRLFGSFEGTESQMAAYEELDQARMTLLQGRLDATADHLSSFNDLLNQ